MTVPDEVMEQVGELRSLRPEAKALARSGHPAARAEGKRALAEINASIKALLEPFDAVK